MQELEKILEEIGGLRGQAGSECTSEDHYIKKAWEHCLDRVVGIILKRMNDGWIPVDKDNIPENKICACDRYGEQIIGYLSYDSDAEYFICENDSCIMLDAIAWKPLDETYHPERSDDHDGE